MRALCYVISGRDQRREEGLRAMLDALLAAKPRWERDLQVSWVPGPSPAPVITSPAPLTTSPAPGGGPSHSDPAPLAQPPSSCMQILPWRRLQLRPRPY